MGSFELDINSYLFIGFLAFNLILGLLSARGITTIKSYAIGDKSFNTVTIASTIVATWVSGEYLFTIISESYVNGISFISVVLLGDFLSLFLIGKFCVPRMGEFLGNLSIAEAMGDLYGKHVRVITAIAGFVSISGIIAIQLKIAGLLFEYSLGIEGIYGIVIAGIVITIYSSLGGIKAVTFTDVVQFATFGVIIPMIAYLLSYSVKKGGDIVETLTTNPAFNFNTFFSVSNPEFYSYLFLFLWLAVPSFNPAFFQRVAMAKDTKQASRAFISASFICLLLAVTLCWIGILLLTIYPGLKQNEILKLIIVDHTWITGFKGLILAGIMAMVMSTVDSYINSSSVLLIHDLGKVFSKNLIKNELLATRFCSAFIGLISIVFALREGNLIDLLLWTGTFYIPVVTVPFLMAIFGFRSSSKSVLIGMGAGFVIAMVWESYFKAGYIGGLIPGLVANLIFLFGSHYLLKSKGGWTKQAVAPHSRAQAQNLDNIRHC